MPPLYFFYRFLYILFFAYSCIAGSVIEFSVSEVLVNDMLIPVFNGD